MIFLLLFALLFFPVSVFGAVPSFPGASGFGSNTAGGRGGTVIPVTTLNETGPGLLAAAIAATGPRIVVFAIGGTIPLTKALEIKNPYITIAGQTAPGDGILLKGAEIEVKTHDVVIRGLRIRVGDDPVGVNPLNRDAMNVGANSLEVYNVIIDHNSLSWSIDENFSTWYPNTHDISFQWNIISESLWCSNHPEGCHGKAFLLGDHTKRISVHHNLFANNNDRNPEIKGDTTAEIVNNLIYNWGTRSIGSATLVGDWEGSGANFANIVGNFYIKGPNSDSSKPISFTSRIWPESKLYISQNIGPGKTTASGDDWVMVHGAASFKSITPVVEASSLIAESAESAKSKILESAGATAPKRDSVDERAVNSVNSNTGKIINSQNEVGGWPTMRTTNGPTDTDLDGMPDAWEQTHGLISTQNDSAQDRDQDGYTNIEEYINSFFTITTTVTPTISAPPCPMKLKGDADCKKDSSTQKDITITDFEIWRKEFFDHCNEIEMTKCGTNDDGIGSAMDADFNYPGSGNLPNKQQHLSIL